MNVNLGPTLDKFVADLVRTGLYQSQSEVVRAALRLMKAREQARKAEIARLRREIAIGVEQADRGELLDCEAVFAAIQKKSKLMKSGRTRSKGGGYHLH